MITTYKSMYCLQQCLLCWSSSLKKIKSYGSVDCLVAQSKLRKRQANARKEGFFNISCVYVCCCCIFFFLFWKYTVSSSTLDVSKRMYMYIYACSVAQWIFKERAAEFFSLFFSLFNVVNWSNPTFWHIWELDVWAQSPGPNYTVTSLVFYKKKKIRKFDLRPLLFMF